MFQIDMPNLCIIKNSEFPIVNTVQHYLVIHVLGTHHFLIFLTPLDGLSMRTLHSLFIDKKWQAPSQITSSHQIIWLYLTYKCTKRHIAVLSYMLFESPIHSSESTSSKQSFLSYVALPNEIHSSKSVHSNGSYKCTHYKNNSLIWVSELCEYAV